VRAPSAAPLADRRPDPAPAVWRFDAIGAPWSIETPAPLGDDARAAVAERIERFDAAWSRFRTDSLVTRMAREAGRWRLPDEAAGLLAFYRELHVATGGRMSPLVGRSLEALGYDAAYRLVPGEPTPAPAWDDAVAWDGDALHLARPALLDVGAAGKGLLVDLVCDVLAAHGAPDAVVDASGDLRIAGRGARGGAPERIALEHPGDPSKAVGVARLASGALAASAANRRAWAGVHHVLDAVTGLPARRIVATWVVAPTAMRADGLATALFLRHPRELAAHGALGDDVEWVRMDADGRLERSAGFDGEVFA
jgi:FAD:protein FMN transferase